MATFDTKSIRNVALLGHGGCGKTSLAEAMLYLTGSISRMGKTPDGNTTCDYDPEEIKRKFSISAAIAPVVWKNIKINILDTPGYLDFVGEVLQSLRVADSALICVDGKGGVEVGTELAWDRASNAGIPKAFFINKCDDADAHFDNVFAQLHDKFGSTVCPVFVPVKDGKKVTMIDLIEMKAFVYDEKGKRTETALTDELSSVAADYKEAFNEAVAGTSDDLMMKYFDGEEITKEEAAEALHKGIIEGTITPVYCGSAVNMWGVVAILDAIAESFPRHTAKGVEKDVEGKDVKIDVGGGASMFVFKTVADPFVGKMSFFKVMNGSVKRDDIMKNLTTGTNEKLAHIYTVTGKKQDEVDELACGDIGMIAKLVSTNTNDTLAASGNTQYAKITYPNPYMAQAMVPLTAADESKISQAISKMLEEDLTVKYDNDSETKQMVVYGLGDMHLAVLAAKLKSRFGVNVKYDAVKIAYREKITKTVDIHARHKKQNGGSGQFGDVWIKFSPGEDPGLTFTVSVVGGVVPKNFNPAVEKGLLEGMAKGIAGFPMTYLAADLHDGSYHPVDSDEVSFRTAAIMAYKQCLEQAGPVLLEPVGDLDVLVPSDLVGDVMGDLNKRRGAVMGMDPAEDKKGYTIVRATAPKSELSDYPIVLRAMTQGRGSFEYKVTGYDVVPGNISSKIVEEYKKSQEA